MSAPPQLSDLNLLGNRQGIIDFDAKITDGAFDLGVTEQQLYSSQVSSLSVDQCRLGSAK
jgi:hypothetical protein